MIMHLISALLLQASPAAAEALPEPASVQAEAVQPETIQPEAAQAETRQAETRQAEPAQAATGQPAFDRAAAIADVNRYLNAITTLRARFIQISPNGSAARGVVSIARPGRLLFEYDDPSPIRVIADGTTVALEDRALETVDRVPLRSTPLWWLLKSDIDIANDAEVVDIRSEYGFLSVIVRDPDGEMDGDIEFVFAGPELELREWFVTDALGEVTRVSLLETETGMALNPRLFSIPEPESRRDSRRGRR
ncbi:LolA family protein [Maricaulis salignorans]|uniref:LolA family protein n=1 Tax=Maricaulis salignorans TaxID=144026 RepID=UPI003A949231